MNAESLNVEQDELQQEISFSRIELNALRRMFDLITEDELRNQDGVTDDDIEATYDVFCKTREALDLMGFAIADAIYFKNKEANAAASSHSNSAVY